MRALLIAALLSSVTPARADGNPTEISIAGKSGKLQSWLWRPAGAGPFPALVYNHGSEKDPTAGTAGEMGPFLSSNGYVVLFPHRRGTGKSEGRYWQDRVSSTAPGIDRQRAAVAALVEENDDVISAVEWLRAQPFVDGKRISVAGCSFGGIEALLSAERAAGLHAVIDFAGGSMSWEMSPPLRERMIAAAERARVPVFFLQAENDFNTTPSKVLAETMERKKLPHRLRIFPPHGDTPMAGHAHFCNHGSKEWGPDVLDFLQKGR